MFFYKSKQFCCKVLINYGFDKAYKYDAFIFIFLNQILLLLTTNLHRNNSFIFLFLMGRGRSGVVEVK